jgi:hypothetical protein
MEEKDGCLDVQDKILVYMGQELQTDRLDMTKQECAEGIGYSKAGTYPLFYAWQDLEKKKGWIVKTNESSID